MSNIVAKVTYISNNGELSFSVSKSRNTAEDWNSISRKCTKMEESDEYKWTPLMMKEYKGHQFISMKTKKYRGILARHKGDYFSLGFNIVKNKRTGGLQIQIHRADIIHDETEAWDEGSDDTDDEKESF